MRIINLNGSGTAIPAEEMLYADYELLKKGLKDVYFDTTETSYIDGSVGKLL